MSNEYPVTLYRIDGEQAVDIPVELELPGDEVIMYREGERLIIIPKLWDGSPADLLAGKEVD